MEFLEALIRSDLAAVRRCPKSDLHNHFVLGGSRRYLLEHSGKDIQPIIEPLHSMDMWGLLDLYYGKEELYKALKSPEKFVESYNGVADEKYKF